MLLDSAVDHLALYGQRVNVAVGLAGAEVLLAAGVAQLQELIALGHANFAHAAIRGNRSPGSHFQVVAVLDNYSAASRL